LREQQRRLDVDRLNLAPHVEAELFERPKATIAAEWTNTSQRP